MADSKNQEVVVRDKQKSVTDILNQKNSEYRQEIIGAIDRYHSKLKSQRMDRDNIKNRLRLLHIRETAEQSDNLEELEKELWSMAVDIEEPTIKMGRNISLVIFAYTVFALFSFLVLTFSNAIILPSFNIPYSVLLMGLIGNLVSMYVKLPNIRIREPLSYDSTIWFVISPPVAVIMAGLAFGLVQIFLPVIQVELSDESWFFWVLAWVVGFVNWVYLYEKVSGGIKDRMLRNHGSQAEPAPKVFVED
ncbi:MAG: hypothetical protein AMJ54_03680 [Deltaproteobacteria bacterium SG8_13]|nr:MAG: hypothetical protein AMJ54_03680 [Deltaproteobacteria bacterium SG8_13]